MNDLLNKTADFFKAKPQYVGLIFVVFGIFMLLAAIKNWDWVFRGSSFNIRKLEGISNMWGRGTARIVAGAGGVFVIIFGIFWFWAYCK